MTSISFSKYDVKFVSKASQWAFENTDRWQQTQFYLNLNILNILWHCRMFYDIWKYFYFCYYKFVMLIFSFSPISPACWEVTQTLAISLTNSWITLYQTWSDFTRWEQNFHKHQESNHRHHGHRRLLRVEVLSFYTTWARWAGISFVSRFSLQFIYN